MINPKRLWQWMQSDNGLEWAWKIIIFNLWLSAILIMFKALRELFW